MLPLCLVTGFLGTGKTSLLKHIVSGRPGAKLVYLVNEFSPEDVDGAVLLDTQYPDVVRLPGGSIFCKCLVTQFISHLNAIPQRFPEAEGVIIEASGMANPKVIESMLEETGLDKGYSLDGIITVVERRSFTALRHTLPNILAQI
ncbi:MAG: GTP-binding protein, partial [Lentisphaerae bacterium]|nr:GTP-binding protein [Lentisphaerota bacterium]